MSTRNNGEDIMKHSDKATEYFCHNFNCSQAVFTTFATERGFDEKLALKLATNFGGGGRKGEMCGAVSGALMVLGLIAGHNDENDLDSKAKAYALSEEFMNRFIEANGTVVCRELLGYDLSKTEDMAAIKEKGLFKTTCPELIRCAADILDIMITEHGV